MTAFVRSAGQTVDATKRITKKIKAPAGRRRDRVKRFRSRVCASPSPRQIHLNAAEAETYPAEAWVRKAGHAGALRLLVAT